MWNESDIIVIKNQLDNIKIDNQSLTFLRKHGIPKEVKDISFEALKDGEREFFKENLDYPNRPDL